MGAEEEWRSKAGPWARATMPDGQELDVVVTARHRSRDGRWWYECEAILPARHEAADGTTKVMGAPTPISVESERIARIPGEDYSLVPTDGAVSGRQWVIERLHQYTEDAPSRRLHRRDCWQVRNEHTLIPTREAAESQAHPDIAICGICRPDKALPR
nr:DUF6233 domain-containing protein [Streptomyces antimycoticus]